MRNYISKRHKIEGAQLQYVRNQYAMFENKGTKPDITM